MNSSMNAIGIVLTLSALMLLLVQLGRRAGMRRKQLDPEGLKAGLGAIDGAVFGLMGLLIAFTFSGAAERFEGRRRMIVQEGNAIGTAYLRIDLLPVSTQSALREDLHSYLDERIAFYQNLPSHPRTAREDAKRSTRLQPKIWAEATDACRQTDSPAVTSLVITALNDMFDIATTRSFALEDHPPSVVFWGLGVLVLAGSLLAGFGMAEARKPSRLHMLIFSAILATSLYVITDLEFPRVGLVRVDAADHVLTDLRSQMK